LPEVVKIGTDWFVKVKCPRPEKGVENADEHIKACGGCPYAIWEKPEMVAGFMHSMCGVRVGSIGMADSLDLTIERLAGTAGFTNKEVHIEEKLAILKMVKSHAENDGWRFRGMTRLETLQQLDLLIRFCERAKANKARLAGGIAISKGRAKHQKKSGAEAPLMFSEN
jgi:hypothetical protein